MLAYALSLSSRDTFPIGGDGANARERGRKAPDPVAVTFSHNTYTPSNDAVALVLKPLLTDGIRLLAILSYGCMTRHDA